MCAVPVHLQVRTSDGEKAFEATGVMMNESHQVAAFYFQQGGGIAEISQPLAALAARPGVVGLQSPRPCISDRVLPACQDCCEWLSSAYLHCMRMRCQSQCRHVARIALVIQRLGFEGFA